MMCPLWVKSGHLSDGCGGKTITMVAQFKYDRHGFEGYQGHAGLRNNDGFFNRAFDVHESPQEILVAADYRHDGRVRGFGGSQPGFGGGTVYLHDFLIGTLPCAAECPLWVKSRHTVTTLRMSAFGGKADLNHLSGKSPLIAKSGHQDEG